MTTPKKVIALLNDLMFTVKIQEAAKRAGLEAVFVTTQQDALVRAGQGAAALILDLNYAAAEPLELIGKLKNDEQTKDIALVGYVSHVQVDLRQAAQEKGCDTVLARSAFSQNLPAIFERYADGSKD
ncbi:MAG TPA: response regulator [Bryobacteraceae bacterium]